MQLKLISSNIRFENEADGKHNWPMRKPVLTGIFSSFSPDIIGTQEGRRAQLEDLGQAIELSPVWDNRDWIEERMYPTLFINSEKFKILDSGDFWLSQTPHIKGSSSFKSAFPRLCTFAKLSHEKHTFFVFNTHLDHILPETRLSQAQVLISMIKEINSSKIPFILMGDFNEGPEKNVREEIENQLLLFDPWKESKCHEEGTHHKFNGDNSNTSRIDWILAEKNFSCESFEIIKQKDHDLYPSDHFPIFASLKLK